jgi:hypothetical protein
MASFRIRFRLNPGREGIALGKLARQTENIDVFLRALVRDMGDKDSPDLWLAKDFQNGSLISTMEYQAVSDAEKIDRFNAIVGDLINHNPGTGGSFVGSASTVEKFAKLGKGLDAGEELGIGLFDSKTGEAGEWSNVSKLHFEEVGKSVPAEVKYVGAVMGYTHDWVKGAKEPYITIRELNSGSLVKCAYADHDYPRIAEIFSKKMAVVIVEGQMSFNRITDKTEITMASGFDIAPDFTEEDYQRFFGCAPEMTGGLTAAEYVRKGRDGF